MGTGRSTACEVVNGVCEAIRSLFLTRYQLSKKGRTGPKHYERVWKQDWFSQGDWAVDGCHIHIIAPNIDPEENNNRKGFHYFILQGFVDIRVCVFVTKVAWPGRVHYARVLINSRLYGMAGTGTIVPNITQCINVQIPPLILGDPAYPTENMVNETI